MFRKTASARAESDLGSMRRVLPAEFGNVVTNAVERPDGCRSEAGRTTSLLRSRNDVHIATYVENEVDYDTRTILINAIVVIDRDVVRLYQEKYTSISRQTLTTRGREIRESAKETYENIRNFGCHGEGDNSTEKVATKKRELLLGCS
jgi:hypothetical protein